MVELGGVEVAEIVVGRSMIEVGDNGVAVAVVVPVEVVLAVSSFSIIMGGNCSKIGSGFNGALTSLGRNILNANIQAEVLEGDKY